MKRIIITLILLAFLFSYTCVYAADGGFSPNQTTVAELQKTALENSRQALIDDVDIKKKEMAVRTVRADDNAMSDSILSVTKPMDVQLELDAAKMGKQDHLNQLKVDVYKAAMNIQLCNKEIELQEYKLTVAQEKLTMAKARLKAATITQDVLDSAQYDVDSSAVDLTNVKEKLNSLYLELRKLLNQPLNTSAVTITDELKLAIFKDIDVDFAINSLYKSETSVVKAAGKLTIAQTAMDIAAKLYAKDTLHYDDNAMDLEEAKLDLAAAKTALDAKVKNKYNDMVSQLDNVELANKYAELSQKKLANAQTKFDKGTITKETYLAAKITLMEAEYAKLSSIAGFNGTKAEFDNMVGN
jgi:outer membrane protein TolC